MRGKKFSISRSGSLLSQSCMSVLRQKQRAGPTYFLDMSVFSKDGFVPFFL